MRFLGEISCFLAAVFSFWWCDVRTEKRWMLKDAGDWVYTMVYWTLRGFVCASWVVRWRGTNVSWVVVAVGASASGLGDIRVCVEVVWFVSPACITSRSIRIFEDDVTWLDYAIVIQGGSLGGFGWWSDVCNLKNVCLFWAVRVFWSGFLRLLFLRQCLLMLMPLTETSISGTSRKLPLCLQVSQYV